MVIRDVTKVRTSDPGRFAWTKLRKFHNVDWVASKIQKLQNVPPSHFDNVRKQARQLRYCMIQAREYFDAAEAVSIATKPNLLYYGTMSLALAEILLKQSGLSSSDKARGEHRHHGLTMSVGGIPKGASLETAADKLRAIPLVSRRGTFQLWHQSSREHPVAGEVTIFEPVGSTSRFNGILGAVDEPYPSIPPTGLTLSECLAALPLLVEHMNSAGLDSHFVRGVCDSRVTPGSEWRQDIRIRLHPDPKIPKLLESIKVNPNTVRALDVAQIGGGFQIDIQNDWVYGHASLPLPPIATVNTSEWRIWTNSPPLNEFGYFYAALFLAGNYARYYPDRWLVDVEQSTPLGLAIEELCNLAAWRVPWLALCELDTDMYVNEG